MGKPFLQLKDVCLEISFVCQNFFLLLNTDLIKSMMYIGCYNKHCYLNVVGKLNAQVNSYVTFGHYNTVQEWSAPLCLP